MYVSSYLALNTALSGVEAAEEELDTTGNNISNENTTDYEDESVTLVTSQALSVVGGNGNTTQIGTGVEATGIVNNGNQYLDSAYRAQNAATSAASTTESYLEQVQSVVGESATNTGALSDQLSAFWKDWNDLADNPTDSGAKQAVVDAGEELASSISSMSSDIAAVATQAQTQYANLTQDASGGEVYDDVTQIQRLNKAIAEATQAGTSDAQLQDQRNAALDDLSSLADTTVTTNSDGTVNVSFGGITNLVQGTTVNWPSGSSFTFPGTASTVGGTLGSLLQLTQTGGTIDQLQSQLDGFATDLASEVNAPTVDGTATATDPAFFTITTGGNPGSAAASLAVNPTLVSSPSSVQTTATSDSGANEIALAEAANSGGTADNSYAAFVEQVGGLTENATETSTTQSALLTQVTNQRQSAEGVDSSQEMTDLVEEQQAYEASAKVMNTFETMMDALMQVVGV